MGKPKDPDYWKKWRATHPAYRERERQRSKRRVRGDRSAEYADRKSRARPPDPPSLLDTDPLLLEARSYVRAWVKQDHRDRVYRDDFEEAVSEVLLAMAEGRTKHSGFMRYWRRRKKWQEHVWTGLKYPPDY